MGNNEEYIKIKNVKPSLVLDVCSEMLDLNNLLSKAIVDFQASKQKIFEEHILTLAEPQIKGAITRGKLKWRGIYLCSDELGEWIEQRGKVISPKVLFPKLIHA